MQRELYRGGTTVVRGAETVSATVRRGAVISELGDSLPAFCCASGRRCVGVLGAATSAQQPARSASAITVGVVMARPDAWETFRAQQPAQRRGLSRDGLEAEEL